MGVWLDTPVGSRLALSGPFSVCPNTSARADHFFVFPLIYSHTQPHTTSHNLTPTHSHAHTLTHTHTHTLTCMHTDTCACTHATVLSLCCLWPPPFSLCHQQHRMDQWILVNRYTRLSQLWYACLKHYQYEYEKENAGRREIYH